MLDWLYCFYFGYQVFVTVFNEVTSQFHFLRPWWLLGLLLIPAVYFVQRHVRRISNRWNSVIAPELLPVLICDSAKQGLQYGPIFAAIGIALAITALAGPTWGKIAVPIEQKHDALVIVLDLSLSMLVEDVKPSRIVAAKRKISDILKTRKEGLTALVVYAGDAYAVTPLTDDADVILSLMQSLHPGIMPVLGSDIGAALRTANDLLANVNTDRGRILLITDDISRISDVKRFSVSKYPLAILGVGTENGGPIPISTTDGVITYYRDANGIRPIPKLDMDRLRAAARSVDGKYSNLSWDNSDFLTVLTDGEMDTKLLDDRTFDDWHDMGYLLIIPIVIILAFASRRGTLVVLLLFVLAPNSYAGWFADIWQSRDQQGHKALREGKTKEAEELFEDENWQAVARYRNENFDGAAELFSRDRTVTSQYNLGNALAKQGLLEEAIEWYDHVLETNPEHEDAKFNRDLVAQILERQKHQQMDQPNPDQGLNQESSLQEQSSSAEERERADAYARWLRRLDEEPGNLLRRKFIEETNQRMRRGESRRSDTGETW